MGGRRDIAIIGGLFAALALFIAFGPGSSQPQAESRPTTHSSGDAGALALYEWARAMGYDAQRLEYRAFELTDEDRALVVLSPSEAVTRQEAEHTLEWVARGGTLILADDSSAFGRRNALLDQLEVDVRVLTDTATVERAPSLQPALSSPALGGAPLQAVRYLETRRDDIAPLLGTREALLVGGLRYGRGYVFVSASAHPLSNAGLREPENAALALNMLRRVPGGGRVLFDEVHHGFVAPPTTESALLSTPWGWAGVYTAVVVAAYLALGGRRFGRPIPLVEETARRSGSEYVESLADMLQRGGKREYVARHYHAALKRRLARGHGVSPDLDDEAFAEGVAKAGELDERQVLALLGRLRAAQSDDASLLRAVAEADALIGDRRRP